MEFSIKNKIVSLCIQGMSLEEKGKAEEAGEVFQDAWDQASHDFEKFMSAHYIARYQKNASDKLKWLEVALQFALKINDVTVESAFPILYRSIASCYEELNEPDQARSNFQLAASCKDTLSEKGPFFHGTKANLKVGDLLTAGGESNYKQDLKMNHIYFTALVNGAGLAAGLAKGDQKERVYVVEPTGRFENDPNVTNNKFPGNPTRSYRSEAPLRIVGEVKDWAKQTEAELEDWRKKLAANKGKIIN